MQTRWETKHLYSPINISQAHHPITWQYCSHTLYVAIETTMNINNINIQKL